MQNGKNIPKPNKLTTCHSEFLPTEEEKKALALAERNLHLGKTLSFRDFEEKLGMTKHADF